jgi:hypothetical protein
MRTYTVRVIGTDIERKLPAHSAREAARHLAMPNRRLIVTGNGVSIRYHVNTFGHIVEQSRYSA